MCSFVIVGVLLFVVVGRGLVGIGVFIWGLGYFGVVERCGVCGGC